MESWIMMFIHAIILSGILYLVMIYGLKQSSIKAETRSVLIGGCVFVYMILFGHGPPTNINKDLL